MHLSSLLSSFLHTQSVRVIAWMKKNKQTGVLSSISLFYSLYFMFFSYPFEEVSILLLLTKTSILYNILIFIA